MCDTGALAALQLDASISQQTLTDILSSSSSTTEVLQILCKWLVQEFYLSCKNRLFNTATDFVDVRQYVDPSTNKYGHETAQSLLGQFDPSWASVQEIQTNFHLLAASNYFSFPVITGVTSVGGGESTGYVTVAFRLPSSSTTGLESYVQSWLHNFYGDSQWGAYTTSMDGAMTTMGDPTYIVNSLTRASRYDINYTATTGSTTSLLYGFTFNMTLSFLPSLYQLIQEATNTGDFPGSVRTVLLSTLTTAQFDSIKTDNSVPYPLPSPVLGTQEDFCASEDNCACLYFSVFRSLRTSPGMPLTTPAHNMYINRFQEPNCLCYISRAVPYGESGLLNPFGICFDQNCLDPTVDRSNFDLTCGKECAEAKERMGSVNWQNNFVNPGTVNTNLIESTCGMEISSISYDTDRWQMSNYLLAGAICLSASVPLYVVVSSILQKRYTFSIWHLVFFLLTSALGGLGMYALVGKYICSSDLSQLDTQAGCFDRLTGTMPLNKDSCDTDAPIFCQCDPANYNQQVCVSAVATSFCKCQNDGLCVPTGGNTNILTNTPNLTYNFNYQLIFLFVAICAVVTPLATLGIMPFLRWSRITHWAVVSTFYTLTILTCFILTVGVPIILTYTLIPERTFVVDVKTQSLVCSVDDSQPESQPESQDMSRHI
jgi:hypothetical protein